MSKCMKLAVLVGATTAALVAPIAAQASTKQVFMGTPPSAQKAFQNYGADVNDFFPQQITVHVGDSVNFVPVGFHTVNLPAKGGNALALFIPNGQKVGNAADAGGNPFWFNGQDQLGFNPLLIPNLYGKSVSYSGKSALNSGLPIQNKPKPMRVTFTKAGTYTYYCDVHPGMKGKVRVVAKKANAPTAKQDALVVKKMVARDLGIAKSLQSTNVPSGTVDVGEAGPSGVEFFGFLPGKLTVPVGTTLTFRMTKASLETHTATTGPGDPEKDPTSYLGSLAKSFESPTVDPAAAYPSDQPGAAASLTPQLHGNGFWNSGVLDNVAASPPPSSNAVQFGAPGTYEFYCLIHPFMHGTITVTG
jgi:plastocyanin